MAVATTRPSARVVGLRTARMVKNKQAIDELFAGMADGLIVLGETILADAVRNGAKHRDPATARKRGVPMMLDTGRVSVFAPVGGKSKIVYGSAGLTQAGNRPRGVRTPPDQAVMIVMFGAPIAHFLELGTVKEAADPFLTPAVMANVGGAGPAISKAMAKHAASVAKRASRADSLGTVLQAAAARERGG